VPARDSALTLFIAGTVALLAGCGGHRDVDDKPARRGVVDTRSCPDIPDAVPREEPLAAYGNPDTYKVYGTSYHVMRSARGYSEKGIASWYGPDFHGKRTSTREPYDMHAMTAAHKTLPLPCYVRVTNLENGRQAVVRVNDRGPFVGDRIIDLSYAAAQKLCVVANGTAMVKVEWIDPSDHTPIIAGKSGGEAGTEAAAVRARPLDEPDNAYGQPVTLYDNAPAASAATDAAVAVAPAASQADRAIVDDDPALRPVSNSAGTASAGFETEEVLNGPLPRLYLQAGAFGSADNATVLVSRLRDAGLQSVSLLPPADPDGLTRVRLGPYADKSAMDADRERLDDMGIASRVVHE
jgi:rare lipoprotein A